MSAYPFMPFLGGEKREDEDFFKNEMAKWLSGLNPGMGAQALPVTMPQFPPASPIPQTMPPAQTQQPGGLKDFIQQFQQAMPPRQEPMSPMMPLAMGLMGMGQQMRTPPRYRSHENPMGTALMQHMLLQQKQAQKPREEMLDIAKLWPAYAHAGDLDKRLVMQEKLADKRAELQLELEDIRTRRAQGLQTQRDEAAERRLVKRLAEMGTGEKTFAPQLMENEEGTAWAMPPSAKNPQGTIISIPKQFHKAKAEGRLDLNKAAMGKALKELENDSDYMTDPHSAAAEAKLIKSYERQKRMLSNQPGKAETHRAFNKRTGQWEDVTLEQYEKIRQLQGR